VSGERPGGDLEAQFAALRAEYLVGAPAKMAELWSCFARVQNGERGAAPDLRVLVHRLAGSGGAYGVPAVTERSRAAEQLIDRIHGAGRAWSAADLEQLRAHLNGVADAFDRARSTE